MEEIFSAWAMLGLQCSNCKRKNEMPIWPLVPMAFVALWFSLPLALLFASMREARRLGVYPLLVLLPLALPVVVFSAVSLLVLFIGTLALKLMFFALLLGWRRRCWFCKERTLALHNLGIVDFATVLRGAMEAAFFPTRTFFPTRVSKLTEARSRALDQNIVVLRSVLGASLQSLAGLHKYWNSNLVQQDMGPLELCFIGHVVTLMADDWGSVRAVQEGLQTPEAFEANRFARYEWKRVELGTDPRFRKILGKRLMNVEAITPVSPGKGQKRVFGWVLRFEENEYLAYFNSWHDGQYLASELPPSIGVSQIETCQLEEFKTTQVPDGNGTAVCPP